jgi:hypothetical protein
MGVLGGVDTAIGFLLAILGERPRLETEGRLLAASHALIARNYLDFNAKTGEKWLDEGLKDAVMAMMRNDYSLRCSRIANGEELNKNLYVWGDALIAHILHREVVSQLESIADWETARTHCRTFFSFPSDQETETVILATFPADLIDQIRMTASDRSVNEIAAELMGYEMSREMAKQFATDIKQQDYRGSVMKIEMSQDQPISNHGFLILTAGDRYWLMDIDPSPAPQIRLYAGNEATFQQLFSSLIS